MARLESSKPHESALARWPLYLVLAVVLIALAGGGYLILERLGALEARNAALTERVRQLSRQASMAERSAELAARRAGEAESSAQTAVEGRTRAEASLQESEERTRSAVERAEEIGERLDLTQAELERLRRERDEEMTRLQRALSRIAETRRTENGVMMSLSDDTIKFDFDQAELKSEYREILSRIAGILLTSSGYRVQIYGHTDDVGTEEYNQTLSERRASAVLQYLIEAGIDKEIISAKGFGKTNPIVEAATPGARARNRRVEIGIIDTLINYTGVAE